MCPFMAEVDIDKAYRLLNVGGTTLVSASFDGVSDIMPATWACALDLAPTKATVVIDSSHFTRPLMEKSGYFSLQLPTAAIVKETMRLGAVSKFDMPDKVEKSGAKLFTMPGYDIPLVEGCAAWMIFKILSEPHNQNQYDLLSVSVWRLGLIRECFQTATGTLKLLRLNLGHFTTWLAVTSTQSASRL